MTSHENPLLTNSVTNLALYNNAKIIVSLSLTRVHFYYCRATPVQKSPRLTKNKTLIFEVTSALSSCSSSLRATAALLSRIFTRGFEFSFPRINIWDNSKGLKLEVCKFSLMIKIPAVHQVRMSQHLLRSEHADKTRINTSWCTKIVDALVLRLFLFLGA